MDHRKIKEATLVLRRGGSVIYPTDTLYGLGVDAGNEQAVEQLIKLKGRDADKKFSVMLGNLDAIEQLAELTPKTKETLCRKLPGAYTFVLNAKTGGTIAIRMPDHPVALELARAFGKPITATSANISGEKPLNSLSSLKSLGADYILWAGPLPATKPSTLVDLTKKRPRVLRRGAGLWP